MLGAGGTGRAAAYGLRQRGLTVHLVNRTLEHAEALARHFGDRVSAHGWAELPGLLPQADLLVNTTSLSMIIYGQDNRALLDALAARPGRDRGIAAPGADWTRQTLVQLHGLGIRGVRLNLLSRGGNDAGLVLELGRTRMAGRAADLLADLLADPQVGSLFLGGAAAAA